MGNVMNAGAWSGLKELGILRAAGTDALAFLQGQLSNDLGRLTRENALLGALNTPQGRVVAIIRLVLRDEGVLAILPASLVTPVIERLKKYVLRSKVTLSDESARLAVGGLLEVGNPVDRAGNDDLTALIGNDGASDGISVHTLPGPLTRHLLVGPPDALERTAARIALRLATSDRWRLAAIECGEPQVYLQTSDLFVAQMLNLDLVDGVSFAKGCYTGQEIIARTQHRGRIKRRMLRYRVRESTRLSPGDSVPVEQRTGRVVEFAARNATEGELLAVVPLEEPTRVSEERTTPILSAERLPLPYSIPDLD